MIEILDRIKANRFLYYYRKLPIIKCSIGLYDKYRKGRVAHIDFTNGECITIWVQYKTKTMAYRTYN